MKSLKESLKSSWGLYLFVFAFVATFLQTTYKSLRGGTSHDFDIFMASARLLLNGETPYGINYPAGQFLYSPAAGLFFYGPLSQIPYAAALIVNGILLFGVFLLAIRALLRADTEISQNYKNLFFLLLTFEAIGSLLNGKFELLSAGIFFLIYSSFITQKTKGISISYLALASNFKLQALAPSGLLLSTLEFKRNSLKTLFTYTATFVAAFLLPALYLGFSKNLDFLQSWKTESSAFIQLTFHDRVHIWNFLKNSLGWELAQSTTNLLSAFFALSFLFYCLILKAKRKEASYIVALRALSLGGAFSVVFSPAAQSSAYILLAPLYWAFCKLGSKVQSKKLKYIWYAFFALGLFFVSLSYSDLVGKTFRGFAREHSFKALGGILFIMGYVYFDALSRSTKKAN